MDTKEYFIRNRRDLLVSIYSVKVGRATKDYFIHNRRDLLVSIYSVKVGRGLDGWIQNIILYTIGEIY